jgi:hypothetical protein
MVSAKLLYSDEFWSAPHFTCASESAFGCKAHFGHAASQPCERPPHSQMPDAVEPPKPGPVGVAFPFGAYLQVNQTGPAHQTVHSLPALRRPNLPCGADFAHARRQRMARHARMWCQCHCSSPLWFKWTCSGGCGDCAIARNQSSNRGSRRYAGARQNHQQYSIAAESAFSGSAFQSCAGSPDHVEVQ